MALVVAAVGLATTGEADAAGPPRITSSTPSAGASNVPLDTSVTLLPSESVNPTTVTSATVQLIGPGSTVIAGSYNSDAAGGVISFTPSKSLVPTTTYTIRLSAGVLNLAGVGFEPFSSTFKTGTRTAMPDLKLKFDRSTVDDVTGPSVLVMGPDDKLYAGTGVGDIMRYTLGDDGLPVGQPEQLQPFGPFARTITGMHFAPGSTANDLRLYVSHGELGFEDMANFTGRVSLLSGPNLGTVQDKIIGLPRSVHDHMNNGLEFDPSGKMYLSVGSISGYGAPDTYWGNREETPLAGAVLQVDLGNAAFSGGKTVNVDTSKGYNPKAATAPVKIYADGLRNAYDLLWHSNGKLYTGGNESAGGNAPEGPGGTPPALTGLLSGRDYFTRVFQNRYYGHPNPSIGNYVLNGGNPTVGQDSFEVPEYPVGTMPGPRWFKPDLDLGKNRSPNGVTEYTSNVFGSTLKNKILVAEFSNGDDILAIGVGGSGGVTSVGQVAAGFYNPLDVLATPDGRIYVAEYGDQPSGDHGRITLLAKSTATTTPVARIDFANQAAKTAPGYEKDYGLGYSTSRGYGWIQVGSSTPLDLTKNGRQRFKESDLRLDTFIHMQYDGDAASGTRAEGRWELAVTSGTYDVTVYAGDANDLTDSVHRINVEGVNAVDGFVPNSNTHFRQGSVRVVVTDGRHTIDALGGQNTKIAYVDVDRVQVPTPPTTQQPPPTIPGTPTSTIVTTPPTVLPGGTLASSRFVALPPTRILDTRIGLGQAGPGPVPPQSSISVPVLGQNGVPAAGATAVVLNVTATNAAGPGYVQVMPTGRGEIGSASNLNLEYAGQTLPNLVVVPVGVDGTITLYTYGGADLVADVFGYFQAPETAVRSGRFVAQEPVRAVDTRLGVGAPLAPVAGGTALRLDVPGIPGDARGVVLNVTATNAAAPGFVQVIPAGAGTYGASSNLNVQGGQTIANLVVVPVSDGAVEFYSQVDVDLVVDVLGYFTGASAPVSESGMFVPLGPARLLDTRLATAPGPQGYVDVTPLGLYGIPSDGVAAVFLNVTATEAAGEGYVQVLPAGGVFGTTSTLNVERPGETIANANIATLGVGGRVSVFTQTGTHLIADTAGFFTS